MKYCLLPSKRMAQETSNIPFLEESGMLIFCEFFQRMMVEKNYNFFLIVFGCLALM